jgi:trigger factor
MKAHIKKLAAPHMMVFTEEAEVVHKLVEEEYEKVVKPHVEANGFRKGNVPRKIAERLPKFDKFTAYKGVFDKLYTEAIKQLNLDVADAQDFEVKGPFDDDSPLVIQARVFLTPKVLSFNIDDVSVSYPVTEVTDEMVEDQIKVLLDQNAKFTNVIDLTYTIKSGDVMIIDYTGHIDGKEFKGGSAKSFKYVVGKTKFIPGFEEQLMKFKVDETGTISVKFPDAYTEELKGKDAKFTVSVKKIESRADRTLEELAQIGEFKSVDEFKQNIREKLIADHAKMNQDVFISNVVMSCVRAAEIEPIPEVAVNWDLENEWNKLMYRLNTTETEHLKKRPNAKEMFFAQRRERSEQEVTVKVFMDYIGKQQNIQVSDEEVEKYVAERSAMLQKSEEERKDLVEKLKNPKNRNAIINAIKDDKSTKYLVNYLKSKSAVSDEKKA